MFDATAVPQPVTRSAVVVAAAIAAKVNATLRRRFISPSIRAGAQRLERR